MDAMLALLQAMRQEMSHISYFAFTATPKDKTYALFGRKNADGKREAHDYYSMKQAIDEEFILDVMQNYTTYDTMYELAEVVQTMLKVLQNPSLSNLDGINEIVMDSLNQVYRGQNLRFVDRLRHFRSLVSHYEPFLKKLHYLMNGREITTREGNSNATFADCIFAFAALRGLRHNSNPVYQQFNTFLENLRQWRNSEAHEAATTTERDIISATHIVVAMYVYIVSQVTTDLEMSDYFHD